MDVMYSIYSIFVLLTMSASSLSGAINILFQKGGFKQIITAFLTVASVTLAIKYILILNVWWIWVFPFMTAIAGMINVSDNARVGVLSLTLNALLLIATFIGFGMGLMFVQLG